MRLVLIEPRQNRDGQWLYHQVEIDPQGQRQSIMVFQRIVGGVSWPGSRAGYIVLVGERAEVRDQLPHLYVIGEYEESTTLALLRRLQMIKPIYHVMEFFTRLDEEPMDFLQHFNLMMQKERKKPLSISQAPYSGGALSFHLNLLFSRLSTESKTLHLGDDSRIAGLLQEIGSDYSKAKPEDYPGPAALGYAVAALDTYPYDRPEPKKKKEAYDPFADM